MPVMTNSDVDHSSPITVADLHGRSGAELDRLFLDADAGSIPDGRTTGTALVLTGTLATRPLAWIARHGAWQGKDFTPESHDLRNLLTPFGVRAIRAVVRTDVSLLDGRPCTVLDYSSTSTVARWVRDEIREVAPGVHLGMVFWAGRRLPLRFALSG